MKCLIFDSSTIISIVMNGLFEELKRLKESFDGKFIIPKEVEEEVVNRPLNILRFKLEALRVKSLINEKVLEFPEAIGIKTSDVIKKTKEVLNISNSTFFSSKENIKIIHSGEAACVALSKILNQKKIENVLAVDERTTRIIIEKPENIEKLLSKKLHTNIDSNRKNFDYFKGIKVIRSTELMYIAYIKGLLEIKDKKVLEAVLYALKLNGCSISDDEIKEVIKKG